MFLHLPGKGAGEITVIVHLAVKIKIYLLCNSEILLLQIYTLWRIMLKNKPCAQNINSSFVYVSQKWMQNAYHQKTRIFVKNIIPSE